MGGCAGFERGNEGIRWLLMSWVEETARGRGAADSRYWQRRAALFVWRKEMSGEVGHERVEERLDWLQN
jgi:hypothetical protein